MKLGSAQGSCRFLLIGVVWTMAMGRVSFRRAGRVLQCGSGSPILEGMWARALGTEVCKHKLGLGLGPL